MNRRYSNAEQKERIRQRVRVQIDEENYQFFPERKTPHVTFFDDTIKFSTECIRRMKAEFHVELLIHPTKRKFAVRAADKQNKNAVIWAKMRDGRKESRSIACAAYADTIYSLFGWKVQFTRDYTG